ncbi:MAG: hypothetical protein AMJ66_07395 [Betaproteobacteria bacterium SG8_40]|jgi:hypothetical protein|nr:MAG: hypothetical protein AMJ66_07395 [Betaproteobacteria bacterium SG8_40]
MAQEKVSASRRGFLVSAGVAGVATAAAVVGTVMPESRDGVKETATARDGGYKVSEHVNKYYRTARV